MADLSPEAQVLKIIGEEADRLEALYARYDSASQFLDGVLCAYRSDPEDNKPVRSPQDLDECFDKLFGLDGGAPSPDECFAKGLQYGMSLLKHDSEWSEFMHALHGAWHEAFLVAGARGHAMLCGGDGYPSQRADTVRRYISFITAIADRYGVRAADGTVTTRREVDWGVEGDNEAAADPIAD